MLPRHFSGIAAASAGIILLAGCAAMGGGGRAPVPDAVAILSDKDGADRGRAEVFRDGNGLRLEIVARGFNPGTYAMHVHAVGKCDAPDYSSAGPHWNPTGAQHGRDNPLGAHHGDLPNLTVEAGTIGRASARIPSGAFSGADGLMDGDGAAFVVHAQPDDLKTDPSGNSGGRIVCGVFTAP